MRFFLLSVLTSTALLACSSPAGSGGSGGAPQVGGAGGGGGASPTGGSAGTGGNPSGGSGPTGGMSSGGMSGGAPAGGGSTVGGGGLASGGAPPSSGGVINAGGTPSGGASGGGGGATGGTADGQTGGSSGATGGGTAECSGSSFCDDFESDAEGMAPAASGLTIEYGWNPLLETGEEAHIQVSRADAHSAIQSVHVDSTANAGGENAPFSLAYDSPGETFYARAWYNVVDLGGGNAVLMAVGPDHNDEIRLRFQDGTITLNSASGDGLNPDPYNCTDCLDVIVGSWFCAELFYDGPAETARLWIDGTLAAEVVGNVGWHSGGNFPSATKVWFGVLGLNGGAPNVFIDDVAVGPNPIGCD